MEILNKKSNATHKILVLSLKGEDKGKSKSITLSAPEITKEEIINQIAEILGGN